MSKQHSKQHWKFINLDLFHTAGHEGHFNKLFLKDQADILEHLIVPPKPAQLDPKALYLMRYTMNGMELIPEVIRGSWASDRLICLGNQTENLPPGLMQDYNASYLQSKLDGPDFMIDDATGEKMSLPSILDDFLESTERVTDPNFCGEHYTNVWVLRNLTRKLYVRSDGIPTIDRHGDRPGLRCENYSGYWGVPGLAQALMLRVAWSSCPDTGMVLQDKIPFHQGAWVGDRFDVRLYDDVAEDIALDGWVDDTLELAKEIFMIWKSENELDGEFEEELDDGV